MDGNIGADVLPHLHDRMGQPIPVIVYSPGSANSVHAERLKAALAKSRGSIDSLIDILRNRIAKGPSDRVTPKEGA
jgi:hypothetical protein